MKESSSNRPEVKEFVEFYLTKGPKLIAEVRYLPLPEKAYGMAIERFRKHLLGTGFGGVPEVGLAVEEILNRNPKL